MKNVSYVINGVFAVAIIILFVLVLKSNETADRSVEVVNQFAKGDSTLVLPVAYINMDSVIVKYNYAVDENKRLIDEWKRVTGILEAKEKELENEINVFQRKYERNAFAGVEQQEQDQARIMKLRTNYGDLRQRYLNERGEDEAKVNSFVADSIITCVKLFNSKANYQIIFNNTHLDNILVADKLYDVTDDVITLLNSRYTKK